jgi:CRISPR-associated endonuclease/helicase Cas3
VRIAREHTLFHQAHDPELVLWLIGVHHGYGRPLFPHADPWDEHDRSDLVNIDGSAATLKKEQDRNRLLTPSTGGTGRKSSRI